MYRTSTHILVIEDNPGDVVLLKKLLIALPHSMTTLHEVTRLSDGVEYLRKEHADAVLLDLGLPDSTGLATFHAFHAQHPDLPIIVLTELNDQEVALEVLRSGGQDYLIKGQINTELLSRSIRYAIERKHLERRLWNAKKETEEAARTLEKSEQRFRSLFENSPTAIFITSPDGTIVGANTAATDIFGWTTEEIRRLVRTGLIEDNPELTSALEERERTGRIQARELTAIRKTGERFPVEVDSVIIPNDQKYSFVMLRDISERKRHDEQLKSFAAELERKVRERTEDLETANRAKDEFLANMSHEIRTPMAGVLGVAEMLLHSDVTPKAKDDLEIIRSSAVAVMVLLEDLFDLSRISQGRFEIHPVRFDLRAMIRNAIGPFKIEARAKDLDFMSTVHGEVPARVCCDKDRLSQVIKNLVSNAIKFTDQGFVRVDVSFEEIDQDKIRLFFSVSDSGVGIPEEKKDDIFDAFTQLDPSYSKRFNGMGLGLSISKSLVEGMGGAIRVDSTKDRGTTFTFHVTCGAVKDDEDEEGSAVSLHDLPPLRILIAEDNQVNRLFLHRSLVQAGHTIVEAENGMLALEKLEDADFDVVLMDIQMPEMDGIEATRVIRSGKQGNADIPIIALTAYALKGDREKFLNHGMDGYVTKPVDFSELARTLLKVTGLRQKQGKETVVQEDC
jgi:PAS domain S-box-containing protein